MCGHGRKSYAWSRMNVQVTMKTSVMTVIAASIILIWVMSINLYLKSVIMLVRACFMVLWEILRIFTQYLDRHDENEHDFYFWLITWKCVLHWKVRHREFFWRIDDFHENPCAEIIIDLVTTMKRKYLSTNYLLRMHEELLLLTKLDMCRKKFTLNQVKYYFR